jgi:hypothetical protein
MSTTLQVQARRVLAPLATMALALATVAAAAQVTAPVQSAVSETITCPPVPMVLLDYNIRGNLNLPQGWTPATKNPTSGETGGNTSVTLVPAAVKVRQADILCGYATCVGSLKECPPLLMLTVAKPSGRQCEETSGFRVRCSLKPMTLPR